MDTSSNQFSGDSDAVRLESLVAKLMTANQPAFLDGLSEATSCAPQGDDFGVRAIREAIRRKSGKAHVEFYRPGLRARLGSEIATIETRLLDLARKRALCTEPAVTQDLISAGLSHLGEARLQDIASQIASVGGAEQLYAFQLLYDEMHSTSALRRAREKGKEQR